MLQDSAKEVGRLTLQKMNFFNNLAMSALNYLTPERDRQIIQELLLVFKIVRTFLISL